VHATAVTASQSMPAAAGQLKHAYNGQLLQLLHALPSGSIVPFVLVYFKMDENVLGLTAALTREESWKFGSCYYKSLHTALTSAVDCLEWLFAKMWQVEH